MNENIALREPFVIYVIGSLAIGVVLLTAAWAALFRRPALWLPIVLAALLGLAYTLFPDLTALTIAWDVLFLLFFNVLIIYALASLIGTFAGDALHRHEQQTHRLDSEGAPTEGFGATEGDEDSDDDLDRPKAPWLPAFRGSWYRPGPV
jgi:hypothetical protein